VRRVRTLTAGDAEAHDGAEHGRQDHDREGDQSHDDPAVLARPSDESRCWAQRIISRAQILCLPVHARGQPAGHRLLTDPEATRHIGLGHSGHGEVIGLSGLCPSLAPHRHDCPQSGPDSGAQIRVCGESDVMCTGTLGILDGSPRVDVGRAPPLPGGLRPGRFDSPLAETAVPLAARGEGKETLNRRIRRIEGLLGASSPASCRSGGRPPRRRGLARDEERHLRPPSSPLGPRSERTCVDPASRYGSIQGWNSMKRITRFQLCLSGYKADPFILWAPHTWGRCLRAPARPCLKRSDGPGPQRHGPLPLAGRAGPTVDPLNQA
jgi:hypothetical protein